MTHGFEFEAAKPKQLAPEDQPYAESMRGERKITSNPSTDQKKVRRAQQRKQAELNEYELEVEAGIRDWFNRFKTPTDPMKNSGVFPDKCDNCHGIGYEPTNMASECKTCGGQGETFPSINKDPHVKEYNSQTAPFHGQGGTCMSCNGSGKGYHGESCQSCRGLGRTSALDDNRGECPKCGNGIGHAPAADCSGVEMQMKHPQSAPAASGSCRSCNGLGQNYFGSNCGSCRGLGRTSAKGECRTCKTVMIGPDKGKMECKPCSDKDWDDTSKTVDDGRKDFDDKKESSRSRGSKFTYMSAIARRAKTLADSEEF